MINSRVSLVVLTLVAGCARTPLPEVPPFDELEYVELGMRARDLMKARPVRHVGYIGFSEKTEHGAWIYHMTGFRAHEEDIAGPGSRLKAVEFQVDVPENRGRYYHTMRVRKLVALLGRPSCRDRNAVVWNLKRGRIVASYHNNFTMIFFEGKLRDTSNVGRRACLRSAF